MLIVQSLGTDCEIKNFKFKIKINNNFIVHLVTELYDIPNTVFEILFGYSTSKVFITIFQMIF